MKLQNRLGTLLRLNNSLTKQKQGETKLFLLLEWRDTEIQIREPVNTSTVRSVSIGANTYFIVFALYTSTVDLK